MQRLYDLNMAIPPSQRCTHPNSTINLDTGSASPVFRRLYRVPQSVESRVSAIIEKWLEDGTIELAPAGCLWNNPLVVVPRPHDPTDVRVCLDPRRLNVVLLNGDSFPIPIVTEIIDTLAGAFIYSSLDLKCSFNQFTIQAQDRPKLAFTWRGVQYMFVGAPFGLTHLSSADLPFNEFFPVSSLTFALRLFISTTSTSFLLPQKSTPLTSQKFYLVSTFIAYDLTHLNTSSTPTA